MDEKVKPRRSKLAVTFSIIALVMGVLALPLAAISIFAPVAIGAFLPSEQVKPLMQALLTIKYASYGAYALSLALALTAVIIASTRRYGRIFSLIAVAVVGISFGLSIAGTKLITLPLPATGINLNQLEVMLNSVESTKANYTPLMEAAEAGKNEEVKKLLQDGADPHVKSMGFLTAGGLAVASGKLETVKIFLEDDAIENDKDYLGDMLIVAAMQNRLDIARLLLDHGAVTERKGQFGMSPLLLAVDMQNWQVADMLLEGGADVNATNRRGWNALGMAAMDGKLDMVQKILDYGGNINAQTAEGWTPLMGACYAGHMEVAQVLISRGAELNIHDREGHTAMGWAAHEGHIDLTRMLQQTGAKE